MAESAVVQGAPRRLRVPDAAVRAAALGGALSVVLGAAGAMVADVTADGVNPGSSAQDLVATYASFHHRLEVGAALSLVAFALQLVFLAPLWARVRPGSESLAVVAVIGGVGSAAALWMLAAFLDTAMVTAARFDDADAARMLLLAGWDTARVATAPNAVMMGACAIAGWRYGVFPRWLTAFSVLLVLLSIGGMLPSGPAGGAALLGGVWMLVVSLHLALAKRPTLMQRRTTRSR